MLFFFFCVFYTQLSLCDLAKKEKKKKILFKGEEEEEKNE